MHNFTIIIYILEGSKESPGRHAAKSEAERGIGLALFEIPITELDSQSMSGSAQ